MIEKELQKRTAGFWIRFLSISIDVILFCAIAISSSLMCIEEKEFPQINRTLSQLKNDYFYYIWFILVISILIIQFLAIPFLFKGKTLGMIIARIEIDTNHQPLKKVILNRFKFGPLLWIFIFVVFVIFVRPTLINKMLIYKYIKENFNDSNQQAVELLNANKLSLLDTFLYSIPSIVSPIIVFAEVFFLISIGFKKTKISIIDNLTNSKVVFINKHIEKLNLIIEVVKPIENKKYQIEWKE